MMMGLLSAEVDSKGLFLSCCRERGSCSYGYDILMLPLFYPLEVRSV